jgi:hypothetical protein
VRGILYTHKTSVWKSPALTTRTDRLPGIAKDAEAFQSAGTAKWSFAF